MKSMKKLVTLLLSLVMLCALAMPAMADETYSITINGAVAGHTYTAYQVFSGVYYKGSRQNNTPADKEYLSDVVWGKDVNGTDIVKELKANTTLKVLRDKFTTVNVDDADAAEKVAYILQNLGDQSEELDEFARVVGHHLKEGTNSGSAEISAGDTTKKGVIPNLSAGYYFVKDSNEIAEGEIATKFLVEVVGKANVTVKAQAPTIEKKIVNGDDSNHTSVNIGDQVEFELTAKVPDMASFDTYAFTISDTLSKSLTFDAKTVVVKIGENTLAVKDNYKLTEPANPETDNTFTIEFTKDQLAKYVKHETGATIVVTYKATLNKNALTTDKESNKATLKYSNNPAGDGTGTVKTPDVPVYIYDFDIEIAKYDGTNGDTDADKAKKLSGANFILYKVKGEGNNAEKLYYVQNTETKAVTWSEDETAATKWITDNQGKVTFQGIAAGTYYLHETQAPAGYNTLKKDVEVKITATYKDNGELDGSSATSTDNGQYIQVQSIANKAGAVLPSTGGIGTTIFYVLGSILALGAAVLLIAKKRMNGQDR